MDRLNTMRSFCRVAESGSFSAAARLMGISAPLVSRHVGDLEAHLGIRLFNRTTRSVELSEAGQQYYPRCVEWLEQLDNLEAQVSGLGERPAGLLRISVPMDFGRLFLGQAIREFLSRAPDVQMQVLYEDRTVRLLQEQVDVAIRIGQLDDSSLVAQKLGEACLGCYAAPEYLARHGAPDTPAELASHTLLEYTLSRAPGRWRFGKQEIQLAGRSRLSGNNGRALAEAACRGLGIARLPEFLVQDHLQAGELVEVLQPFRSTPLQINAVYLQRRFKPAKLSAFLDYLAEFFARQKGWQPRRV
jgi:DNA-binding transcriptional LysR family regulator